MVEDYWPTLYDDPYAFKRIKKSVELADLKSSFRVLDVGCHKKELRELLPLDTDYHGMDIIQGDNFDGGFERLKWIYKLDEKFDRIFCLETLEHLKDPGGTLESIRDCLKDDGITVISLPNEATIFHRIRGLFGVMDQECFSSSGKHLHLPSLKQSRNFVSKYFHIEKESYYINLFISSSQQANLLKMTKLLPEHTWQFLADKFPSWFSRGFIFKLRKKTSI